MSTFEVDSRPVVIPATKGRIMRHRPRFDSWRMKFQLELDDSLVPSDVCQQLLEEGGRQNGLGDFRPMFGRFRVFSWSEISEKNTNTGPNTRKRAGTTRND